jgi:hypothetical protein
LDALSLTLEYRSIDELGDSLDALSAAIAALAMYPKRNTG